MVVLAAAAIGAAAVGAYKGGKAAVNHTKKKLGERCVRKSRDQERKEAEQQRELEAASLKTMSFEERLEKYKRESGLPTSSQAEKKGRSRNLRTR